MPSTPSIPDPLPRFADRDLHDVMALEVELQRPETRADPARLARLLAADFEEVGVSGRVWDRAAVLELLATETRDRPGHEDRPGHQAAPAIALHDLTGAVLADGVIALRWDSGRGAGTPQERRARRTSLWRRDPGGWRIVRHQGTPLPDQRTVLP